MLWTVGGRPGLRRVLVSYFRATSLRCQTSTVGCHREDPGPQPPRDELGQRGEPGPVGGLVPDPTGVPPQHCVLVPKHQQLSVFRAVAARQQHHQPKQPAHQQVNDLQGHPASQPSQRQTGCQ